VCQIKTGQLINKKDIFENQGVYPVINSGREPLGFYNDYNTNDDPIGITTRGAGVGSVTWCEGKYFRGNLNYSATITNNNILLIRFLYFVLNHLQPEIQALATHEAIPALNKSNLETLQIPLPPLPVQAEIVRILDKFNTLTTSLATGLPAEIALRNKQYAYYRNKLLQFKAK
jgi:type I restriction enzyme S subunit